MSESGVRRTERVRPAVLRLLGGGVCCALLGCLAIVVSGPSRRVLGPMDLDELGSGLVGAAVVLLASAALLRAAR